jgi:hypothetical protein
MFSVALSQESVAVNSRQLFKRGEKMDETYQLTSQTDARQSAKAINEAGKTPVGTCAIAIPWPLNSWGGQEEGWTVAYVLIPQ